MADANARRVELLAAARRTRIQWIEDARETKGSGAASKTDGPSTKGKARRNTATQMLEGTEVATALPSSVRLLDYLNDIVDDDNADGGGMGAAMDMHDDMPVPTHETMEGASAYDVLLEKLKHPQAAEVTKSLERFVAQFEAVDVDAAVESPMESDRPWSILRTFLGRLAAQMKECSLWSMESDEEWETTLVAVESFLFRKVSHKTFAATVEERAADKELDKRLRSLAFIDVEHLDIKSLQHADADKAAVQWDKPLECLRGMSRAFGPSAKIDMVVNCSREITKVLTIAKGGELPGADDFLPAMILVVKRANPPQLHSNLQFIQQYCPPHKLMSEAGYIFTHVQSAVSFLQQVSTE